MKRNIIILSICLLTIVSYGCSSSEIEENIVKAIPVTTQTVQIQDCNSTLDYLGTIEADIVKKYSFEVSGKIDSIYVETGEEITNNKILAVLESEDYSLSVDSARATFNKAKSSFEYAEKYYIANKQLYDEGAISEFKFDSVKTEYEVALSTFDSAKTLYANSTNQLESTTLTADFSGFVLDILYEEGELVSSGYPVIIASNNIPKVTIGLPPDDINKINEDMNVLITIDNKEFKGKIDSISKLPDINTRTYTATISFDSDNFTIGQFAEVSIIIGTDTGILIPISSIKSDSRSYVYIVDSNNKATRKYIELGKIVNEMVLVEGLSVNDNIITSNLDIITDSDIVKIMNSED